MSTIVRRDYGFCAKCLEAKDPSPDYTCITCRGLPGLYKGCAVCGGAWESGESRDYVHTRHLAGNMPPQPNGWVGTYLDNGAIVVAIEWIRNTADDREGIVLAYWKASPDPYVTWAVGTKRKADTTPMLVAYSGHYFDSIVKAAEDYQRRGGR